MIVTKVEAFALAAPNPATSTYWGKATWGETVAGRDLRSAGRWGSGRFPSPARLRPSYSDTIDTTVVRIETDDGLVGWGEAKSPVAPRVTKTIIDELLAPIVLGQDPFDSEVLWETMYASMRLRGHAGGFFVEAISGVDIALWDLVGKAVGKPIHKLLGGAYRDRVLVYASGVPATTAAEGEPDWKRMIDSALEARRRGFRGLKMGIGLGPQADLRSVAGVREAVGADMAIFADAAGNYDVPTAIRVGQGLEELGVGFFEAPLPHEHIRGYGEVARAVNIPVANDVLTTRYQVRDYLMVSGLGVAQPDVCRAGGITELKRIATLTDTFGVGFTPHVSIGSAIHFAASFQVAAAVANLVQMEYWFGQNPLGDAVLRTPALSVVDGTITVPTGPGLGIEIDEDKLRDFVVGPQRAP